MSGLDQHSPKKTVEIDVFAIFALLWRRGKFLGIVAGTGVVLAGVIAFLIPKEYESRARLMPPDQQSISGSPMMMGFPSEGAGALTANMGGGLLSSRTAGQTAIGILMSDTVQGDIVNRFGLKQVYHTSFDADARMKLGANTTLDEDPKSGIVSITVTDQDPTRARDIAEAYVENLSRLVNTLSTSSARRERIFLEDRLESIKTDLDVDSQALSQFSSRTATINPQKQGEVTVETAAKLQGELIVAKGELSELRAVYAPDNIRVRSATAHVDELQSELSKLTAQSHNSDGTSSAADSQSMPSIRELPLLGVTYEDLYRKVTTEETLYALLTKQYELAKVQEAKEIPPVKVLDEPEVSQKKSSPHRVIIAGLGGAFSLFAGILWVLFTNYRHHIGQLFDESDGNSGD